LTADGHDRAASLEDLPRQRGVCGGDHLLGRLLLSTMEPPEPILLSTDGLASSPTAPLPEVGIESVEFLLAGQVAVQCGAEGACVANRVPLPGSLPLAVRALAGLALKRRRRRA
jgi:hypothetical protein